MPGPGAAHRRRPPLPVVPPDPSAGPGAGGSSQGLGHAHAALLRHPVLEAGVDPDGYRLARWHLGTLRTWHQRRTGWTILARGHTLRLVRAAGVLPTGVLH